MSQFKNPVPDDRTIVSGIWSDLLDNFLASFDVIDGVVHLKTFPSSMVEGESLKVLSTSLNTDNELTEILNELKLLNARIEDAFDSGITKEDLE